VKTHLEALCVVLDPLEYVTHLFAAPEVSSQYLVLGAGSWGTGVEGVLCGPDGSLDTEVRIKAVAGTPEGVSIMLSRVRDLLSPDRAWSRLSVSGRAVQVRFERSEFVTVDIDVTITNTDRHPAVGVDSYRLVSEPI